MPLQPLESDITPDSKDKPETTPINGFDMKAALDDAANESTESIESQDEAKADDSKALDSADLATLRAVRDRIDEPVLWRHPSSELVELEPFTYNRVQYWATIRALDNSGELDDAQLLIWVCLTDKKTLRRLWSRNVWTKAEEAGQRNLSTDDCPMYQAFKDWQDETFSQPDIGDPSDPHSDLGVYSEVMLRKTAARVREDGEDSSDADEKKS